MKRFYFSNILVISLGFLSLLKSQDLPEPLCKSCDELWPFCTITIGPPGIIQATTLIICNDERTFKCNRDGLWSEEGPCAYIEGVFKRGGKLVLQPGFEMPEKYVDTTTTSSYSFETTSTTSTTSSSASFSTTTTSTQRPWATENENLENFMEENNLTAEPTMTSEEEDSNLINHISGPLTNKMAMIILLVLSALTLLGTFAIILLCCRHYKRRKNSSYQIHPTLSNYSPNQYYQIFEKTNQPGLIYHPDLTYGTLKKDCKKAFINPPPVPKAFDKPLLTDSQLGKTYDEQSIYQILQKRNDTFTYMTIPLSDYEFFVQDLNGPLKLAGVPDAVMSPQYPTLANNKSATNESSKQLHQFVTDGNVRF